MARRTVTFLLIPDSSVLNLCKFNILVSNNKYYMSAFPEILVSLKTMYIYMHIYI